MVAWRRFRDWVASHLHQRITRGGAGFLVTTGVIAALAVLSANNLLFLLLGCLLAALMMSSFLNRLSLAGLELDLTFPEHVPARRKVPARMKIRNEKGWMPSFSIHVSGAGGSVYSSELYFPVLPGGATVEETVEVYFQRRGPHTKNSFQFRSAFPFGFAERMVEVTLRREVLAYPSLDAQPGFVQILGQLEEEIEAQVRGRGHDFYRIRPYEPLESARHVDWKATAHTGELQVREFAREQEPLVELVLDLVVDMSQWEWFERAVDCCAYLCWETARKGARIRFRTQDVDVSIPVEGDVYTILKYLALVEPKGRGTVLGPGLEDSVQVVVSASPERFSVEGWQGAHIVGRDALMRAEPTAIRTRAGS